MTAVEESPAQLPLIPEQPPVIRTEDVLLDRLPPDNLLLGDEPDANLLESIRRWGVLDPLIVRAVGGSLRYDDPSTFVAGRRRLKAVRRLHAEAIEQRDRLGKELKHEADRKAVPGYVDAVAAERRFRQVAVRTISDPEGATNDGRTNALVVASNAVRRANAAADYDALDALRTKLLKDGPVKPTALVSALAKATGMSAGTIKQRLRLDALVPALLVDLLNGRLSYTVALEASRLTPDEQNDLRTLALENDHSITLVDVKQVKMDRVRNAQASLFDALPDAPQEGMLPDGQSLRVRADRMIETLRSTNLPICLEAASLIADLSVDREQAGE